jgi:hypothetical protein
MRDEGYTATEALAALAIIGLAVGGLTSGMQVIGRAQSATSSTVAHAAAIRTTSVKLDQMLANQGPFRSDHPEAFNGDGTGFKFPCGAGLCGARVQDATVVVNLENGVSQSIPFPAGAKPRFLYGGSQDTTEAWPPPPPPPDAPPWQTLQFVTVRDTRSGRAAPVVVSRVWVQQRADCDFDAIIQDCRGAHP